MSYLTHLANGDGSRGSPHQISRLSAPATDLTSHQDNLADVAGFPDMLGNECYENWPFEADGLWDLTAFDYSDELVKTLSQIGAYDPVCTSDDIWGFNLASATTVSCATASIIAPPQHDLDQSASADESVARKSSISSTTTAQIASSYPRSVRRASHVRRSSQNDNDPEVGKSRVHYASEKRYRANINGKMEELNKIVPSLDKFDDENIKQNSVSETGIRKSGRPSTVNKAFVLEKAIRYIRYLETNHQEKEQRIRWLKDRVRLSLEILKGNGDPSGTVGGMDPMQETTSLLL